MENPVMIQSQFDPTARQLLAAAAVESKTLKDLSWHQIADAADLSVAFTTAAVLGQHALPEASAKAVCGLLELDDAAVRLLQAIPTRGSIPGGVPTDPTIYRFYEMVQVYGTTLKALIHKQFGDGIISAINFRLDIKKVADPARVGTAPSSRWTVSTCRPCHSERHHAEPGRSRSGAGRAGRSPGFSGCGEEGFASFSDCRCLSSGLDLKLRPARSGPLGVGCPGLGADRAGRPGGRRHPHESPAGPTITRQGMPAHAFA